MKFLICLLLLSCVAFQLSLSQSNGQFVGTWKIDPSSIIIQSQRVRRGRNFNPGDVTLTIRRRPGINKFAANLKVVNSINFDMEETVAAWKKTTDGSSTLIGLSDEYNRLENAMYDLVQEPGFVQLLGTGNGMTISKDNTQATFIRVA